MYYSKVNITICIFIGNLDILPLISPSDIVSIDKLTLILKIIGQSVTSKTL